jgi:23S rRNA (adenine-N6)-dimethyltransferase
VSGSRRAWGWHRLDPTWAERIVADSGVGRGDLVVDIGAGSGALTAPILATGARVLAVERHPGRAARLRERFGDRIVVIEADAADLRLPRRPFHVVANPPFAISAAILRRLLHDGSRLRSAHLVLADAVVRRWTGPAAPAASRWRRAYTADPGRPIPRSAFRPPPRTSCRVLVLHRTRPPHLHRAG